MADTSTSPDELMEQCVGRINLSLLYLIVEQC